MDLPYFANQRSPHEPVIRPPIFKNLAFYSAPIYCYSKSRRSLRFKDTKLPHPSSGIITLASISPSFNLFARMIGLTSWRFLICANNLQPRSIFFPWVGTALILLSVSSCRPEPTPKADQPSLKSKEPLVSDLPKAINESTTKARQSQIPLSRNTTFRKFDDLKTVDSNQAGHIKIANANSLQKITGKEGVQSGEADQISNPVDIVRQAGAIPPNGASKGEYLFGYWTAKGEFPSRTDRWATDIIRVYSFQSPEARNKHVSDKVTDDSQVVLISKNRPFYAILHTFSDQGFEIEPAIVAQRLNAAIKP